MNQDAVKKMIGDLDKLIAEESEKGLKTVEPLTLKEMAGSHFAIGKLQAAQEILHRLVKKYP